jgi:hypothetical protein
MNREQPQARRSGVLAAVLEPVATHDPLIVLSAHAEFDADEGIDTEETVG